MRVLFTVQPSTGHLHPLVPVASCLTRAGHDVAVCSSASFRPEVEAFGLRHIDGGLDWLTGDQRTWRAFPPMPPPGPEFARFVVTMFADVTTARMVPDLLELGGTWKPDLIVRESMEYGGCIAAEVLGIPHASVAGNAHSAVDSPTVHYFTGNRRLVAEPLGRHRERFGLPPDPDVQMPFRYLHLCFTPPSWDGTDVSRPPNTHFLRHVDALARERVLPGWVDDLPTRPTVLASLGTVFNKTPGVLEAIVAALGGEPFNAIVAIGRDQDLARFGSPPPNIRLEPYVPQPLLLARCDAFVTHAGFNSVKESLAAGVPMVALPITADQPYSAQRCAALGVAKVLGPSERSAASIREAIRDVLDDGRYREQARRFQAEMAALPGPDRVVEVLEDLAVRHEPLGASN